MRLVIDTDVLVAPSAVRKVPRQRCWPSCWSVAMALEYEATATRKEHLIAANASEADVTNLISAIIDAVEPVDVHYQWRPQLSDAGDEMVLEAAVNGRANAIVTFNRRHFADVPARFGIAVISPAEALERIRQRQRKSRRLHCGCRSP